MKEMDSKSYVVHLTVEELVNIQYSILEKWQEKVNDDTKKILKDFLENTSKTKPEKKFEYGLKGLAKILGVSKSTAARIKSSGDLDEAIEQNGGIIRIDVEKAQFLYYKNK